MAHWSRRRRTGLIGPVILAIFATVGTLGAAHGQPDRRAPDALAVLIAIAGPAALVFIWRYPLPVLAWITSITAVYLLRGYPYGPVFAAMGIAVVIAVIRGLRPVVWGAVAAVFTAYFGWRGLIDDRAWSWGEFAGVSAWVLLVLVFAEFARGRRERARAAWKARSEARRRHKSEERLRIAREVHDIVAHHMSLINVQASAALHLVDKNPDQAHTALVAIKTASKEALTELRTLVGVLRDDSEAAPRLPSGQLAAIDDLIDRIRHAGLQVDKTILGAARPLPQPVDLAAYRIVQEAITNVVRHAEATRASITVDYGAGSVSVRIDDNGCGFGAAVVGNGISGMRERATALGGFLEVGPSPLGGTQVHAVLAETTPATEER